MGNVLVIGSINMDFNIQIDRLPHMGETLSSNSCILTPGGKGANQAIAVAKLGGNVNFICAVGNDANGKDLLKNLNTNNVSYDAEVIEGASGTAIVTVVDGNNCIIVNEGANGAITPEIIKSKEMLFHWADIIVLQLEIPITGVEAAIELGYNLKKTVILNPAPAKELQKSIFKKISYIVPNEHEAEILTGIKIDNEESVIKAIDAFKQLGVKEVIITLGNKGCAYTKNGEVLFEPAIETKVVDTTAAGDCFIGTVSVMLSMNKDITDAVKTATKASSVTVSRSGAASSIPTLNEIE